MTNQRKSKSKVLRVLDETPLGETSKIVRQITDDESHMLAMMNSEYSSKRPCRRTLRALWRLQSKELAYKNYGVWRKTLLGERVHNLLDGGND